MARSHSSHRVRSGPLLLLVGLAIISTPVVAFSQSPAGSEWTRGVSLAGFAGGASGGSNAKAVAGTGLGWEVIPHFTLEGRGMWFEHAHGSSDFAGMVGALFPVLPGRTAVPFASAGIGMYRANVDAGLHRNLPEFYRARMNGDLRSRIFQDFMMTFGGGVDVFLTSHFALRPEVSVMMVTADSDSRTFPVYTINASYHFETHTIR